jgi:hypothetical protein
MHTILHKYSSNKHFSVKSNFKKSQNESLPAALVSDEEEEVEAHQIREEKQKKKQSSERFSKVIIK